jgi:DNA ligase-1
LRAFAELFTRLDQTNKTNTKLAELKAYLSQATDGDKLWALGVFTGKRPRRPVSSRLFREWAAEAANLPEWLFNESYHVVGDLSETIALVLPPPNNQQDNSLSWWMNFTKNLSTLAEPDRKEAVLEAWDMLEPKERFVFNKLMSGSFRVGISQNLMVRAIAEVLELDIATVAHRLMGNWHPDSNDFNTLFFSEDISDDLSRPYPFYLAYPLENEAAALGSPNDWQAEWKWDGIRSQAIKREGELYIWSRGEELITDKFPELVELKDLLPDGTVVDGELLPVKDGLPMPFSALQTRIGRKNISKKLMQDVPIRIYAYDLLEWQGKDIREEPLSNRRNLLENLIDYLPQNNKIELSPIAEFTSWEDLAEAREDSRQLMAEGFMIKAKNSTYKVGRKRGDWWKWKVEPLTIDGVLVYAQKGSGRRADLYSDYTFAVWQNDQLVPFAKAYSGLTDAEMRKVDSFVKRNTKERFGPVRTVKPKLVFEIGFEGIQLSKRHKSGVALRFPRILRWRLDKKIEDANTLDDLQDLLKIYGNADSLT